MRSYARICSGNFTAIASQSASSTSSSAASIRARVFLSGFRGLIMAPKASRERTRKGRRGELTPCSPALNGGYGLRVASSSTNWSSPRSPARFASESGRTGSTWSSRLPAAPTRCRISSPATRAGSLTRSTERSDYLGFAAHWRDLAAKSCSEGSGPAFASTECSRVPRATRSDLLTARSSCHADRALVPRQYEVLNAGCERRHAGRLRATWLPSNHASDGSPSVYSSWANERNGATARPAGISRSTGGSFWRPPLYFDIS